MQPITDNEIGNALNILADVAADRQNSLEQYPTRPHIADSDDEPDSQSPIFDQFYQRGGSSAILTLTNFTPTEFFQLWNLLSEFVIPPFTTGRGRRSRVKPLDLFFNVVARVKTWGNWEFLARMFNMKGPTFERLVMRLVNCLSKHAYKTLVLAVGDDCDMDGMLQKNKFFRHFKFARYATDVTFQQSNRPSGNLQEAKAHYSGKHKLYGYQVEVSVLPNGLALCCSRHYPAATSDIDIFQRMRNYHLHNLKKSTVGSEISDTDPLSAEHPEMWGVLVDKGYQGAQEFIRAVHPIKKPPNSTLTLSEEQFNRRVASDRIIVENYFGRVCGLWSVLERKWRWAEESYDNIFRLCLALTNWHVRNHPLRRDDFNRFQRIRNRLYEIGTESALKRKRTLERYRAKRRRRMDIQFRAESVPDREVESED